MTVPLITRSDIKCEYRPLWGLWGLWVYWATFYVKDKKYIVRNASKQLLSEVEILALIDEFQNSAIIRYGAVMKGYQGNKVKKLYKKAKEFFDKNPQYEIVLNDTNSE